MAMATGPGSRTIENQWTCALLASPNRVQGGGDVTFSVKLSNPGIAQLFSGSNGTIDSIPNIPGGQISAFYELFNYIYDPGDSQLSIPTSNPAEVRDQQSPVGTYTIKVTVTAKDPGRIEDWFENNASLVAPEQSDVWRSLGSTLSNQTTGEPSLGCNTSLRHPDPIASNSATHICGPHRRSGAMAGHPQPHGRNWLRPLQRVHRLRLLRELPNTVR